MLAVVALGAAASRPAATSATFGSGIRLCKDLDFTGWCDEINHDIAYLSGFGVGNDSVSSVRVFQGGGAFIALYADFNYQGTCQSFSTSVADLRGTRIGNDTASSARLFRSCSGVVLFKDTDYWSGDKAPEPVDKDIPDLRLHQIGNDSVSSLTVDAGKSVTLYADINYQGTCQSFTADTSTLVGTRIGNDTASSLRLGTFCSR